MAEQTLSIRYSFRDIKILKFYAESLDCGPSEIPGLKAEIRFSLRIEPENDGITVILGVELARQSDATKVAELEAEFKFSVIGMKELPKVNDKIDIPLDFLANLLGLSYGTLRGIFYEKVSKTVLCSFILPLIQPKKMLESNMKKEQEPIAKAAS
jgi:hypothetical protein